MFYRNTVYRARGAVKIMRAKTLTSCEGRGQQAFECQIEGRTRSKGIEGYEERNLYKGNASSG